MLLLLLLSFCSQHGQSSSLLLFGVRTERSVSAGWFNKRDPVVAAAAAAASKQRILTTLIGLRAGYNAAGDLLGDDDDDDEQEEQEEDYSLPPTRPCIQQYSDFHPLQQQQESQQEPLVDPQSQPNSGHVPPAPRPRRALILMDAFCDYHGLHLADRILQHDEQNNNDNDDKETAVIFVLSDYLRGYLLKTQPERAATWQAMRMPRHSSISSSLNNTNGSIQQQQDDDDDDAQQQQQRLLQQWTLGLEIVGVYCESDSGLQNAEELRLLLNVTHQDDPPILPARRDKFLMNERIANNNNNMTMTASLPVARQQLCSTFQQAQDFCIQQLGMSSLTSSLTSSTDESSRITSKSLPCRRRVVVKPCRGVASEDVRLCRSIQQVEAAFDAIIGTPIFGSSGRHEAVLVQEYLVGREYAVDIVCRHGDFKVAAVWRYDKRSNNINNNRNGNGTTILGADFCYFKTELVDATMDPNVVVVCDYVKQALQALGIRQGLSHTEVIVVTESDGRGPVLVEVNCRQHNMDFIPLAMLCIGYNALDMTLTALLGNQEEWDSFPDMAVLQQNNDDDGSVDGDHHRRCRHGCMVHLVNSNTGTLTRVQYMEEMSKLPSFLNGQVYPHFLEVGSKISPTIDIKSDAGWIQLVHENVEQLDKDYKQILEWMPTMFNVDE